VRQPPQRRRRAGNHISRRPSIPALRADDFHAKRTEADAVRKIGAMMLTSIDLSFVAKTISNKDPWMGGSMPASEPSRKYAGHGIGREHINPAISIVLP
jgi:hypothetical protein